MEKLEKQMANLQKRIENLENAKKWKKVIKKEHLNHPIYELL